MKRPVVGPFLGGFYFYEQTLQTMSQGCSMLNIRVFGLPVHEKKIFLNSPNFTLFPPYWVPIGASPFIFANFNPHSQRCFLPNLVEISFLDFGEVV